MNEEILKSARYIVDDIDDDGEKEEIIAYIQKMTVLRNGEKLWEKVFAGVPLVVRVHDINGDGKKEILVGGSERKIYVFSPEGEELKVVQYWSPGDKRAGWVWDIHVEDVDDDGKSEILVGGMAAWGGGGIDVKLYNNEFEEVWTYHVPRSAFRLGLDDIDGDGEKEVVVTTMIGDVKILDRNGKEKKKTQVGAGVSALEIVDITGDGKKEILVGTVDGDFVVLDHNLREKWKAKVSSYYPVQVYNIVARDFNSDGKKEILVASRRCTILFDISGGIVYKKDDNVLTGDIDKDGKEENLKMYVEKLEAVKGNQILWSRFLPDRLETVALGDLTGDGNLEIVVGMSDGLVEILNNNGEVLKTWKEDVQVSVVQVGDYNNDGKLEVLVGTAFGNVRIYDADGNKLNEHQLYGEIGSIAIFDIDRDGKKELIVSTKNQASELRIIKP
ncbi:MAG: FG-GAP repeat domain-containing protein [Candidatus Njordarchaeia archaeon]